MEGELKMQATARKMRGTAYFGHPSTLMAVPSLDLVTIRNTHRLVISHAHLQRWWFRTRTGTWEQIYEV